MRISKQGLDFIKSFEGCRLEAYHGAADRPGLYTIGYGHTGKVQMVCEMMRAFKDQMLDKMFRMPLCALSDLWGIIHDIEFTLEAS